MTAQPEVVPEGKRVESLSATESPRISGSRAAAPSVADTQAAQAVADTRAAPAEQARLAAVRRLEASALGSRALQRITDIAARVLGAEVAQISLLGEVHTAVAATGRPTGGIGAQLPLADSLCAVTVDGSPDPLILPDTAADPRVAGRSPVVSGEIGAYLGVALPTTDGVPVGALCAYGAAPRNWSESDVAVLRLLAHSAASELELSALSQEFEAHRLRFELAIDAAEIGSFDWDLVTGRLIWDDRLVELFGYDRDSFDETIESFNARLHPDDRPRVDEALQKAIDSCGAYEAEFRIVLPTGETRWVMGRGRALGDDRGVAVRMLGAAHDTTHQRHGDARVARVLETMNAAFFALDRQWRFTYVNAECERLLQTTREELVGGSLWELFPFAVGSVFETHYRGAMATGEERIFEAYYPPPLDAWYEVRAWPGPDGLSVFFVDVSQRRVAEARARRSADRLSLVAGISGLMSTAVGDGGERAALQKVAEAVVPTLGDWVIVSLIDEDGRLGDEASWHSDPGAREAVARYAGLRLNALNSEAPVMRALVSGEVLAVPGIATIVGQHLPEGEVREVFESLAPDSAVVLPLVARGRTLGAVSVYRSGGRPEMDDEDLAAAREVADRVALGLDNARLYEQQRRLAESLQRSMLTAPPEPDHAEIAVRYSPAMQVAQVGGDWYDAFLQPGGATMLVIGDVVGHDTEAAAAMGQLRGLLRGIAYRDGAGPAEVLRELDLAMQGLELGAMATAAIARVEQSPEDRAAGRTRLRWSNAGHPPPLLMYPDGRIEELVGERTELMLGVDPSVDRSDWTVTVPRGVTVLLYTDGLIEAPDLLLDDGVARLRTAMAELADQPLERLCDAVLELLHPEALHDDVALVALRLHPQDQPRPSEAGPAHLPPGIPPEPVGG